MKPICPNCDNGTDLSVCDNDCETFFCQYCKTEFYLEDKNVFVGHKSNCGVESSEEDETFLNSTVCVDE